jgi:aminopeptidase
MLSRTTRTETRELDSAAEVVLFSSLRLTTSERCLVVADFDSYPIAQALQNAARKIHAECTVVYLEELAARPLTDFPESLERDLSQCGASIYVASNHKQELQFRQKLLHLIKKYSVKHAHMPGISPNSFARGARIPYEQVALVGRRMYGKLASCSGLVSQNSQGTHLTIEFAESTRWFAQLGVLAPGRWGNLPAGALYASPRMVEGTFVANAALGSPFGSQVASLLSTPVIFTIKNSRVEQVIATQSATLTKELQRYLASSPNSNRIGLVCIGVNTGILNPTNDALVDQNLPGLHLSIGDPAAKVTGADWTAPTSLAVCQAASSVWLNGIPIIHRGHIMKSA